RARLMNKDLHAADAFVVADEIPDGDEAAAENAENAEDRANASEEFQRLDIAHGAEDDRQGVCRVAPDAGSDTAAAMLAYASNFQCHFDDAKPFAEQVDECFLGVGESPEQRKPIRGFAVQG